MKKKLNRISKTNSYYDSSGNSYSQNQVNNNITNAKAEKIDTMISDYGYVFCEDCKINSSAGEFIDCSHDISVQQAKNERKVELSWDVNNITMRCRPCHRKWDKS